MSWKISCEFEGKEEDIWKNYHGFIYKITDQNGKFYIGRKAFQSKRKKKLTKKELAEITDKRLKKWKWDIKESNWREYNSSCKPLVAGIAEGSIEVSKEIIKLVERKEQMTYYETKAQFEHNVLEVDSYNENILGKFFRKILQ